MSRLSDPDRIERLARQAARRRHDLGTMTGPSVTLAEIDEQRAKGWPDFHPEDYCHCCGGRNVPSWFVDSDRFNAAFGPFIEHPHNGIVCPGCFVTAHEAATGLRTTWRLVPSDPFRPVPTEGAPQ